MSPGLHCVSFVGECVGGVEVGCAIPLSVKRSLVCCPPSSLDQLLSRGQFVMKICLCVFTHARGCAYMSYAKTGMSSFSVCLHASGLNWGTPLLVVFFACDSFQKTQTCGNI